MAYGGGVIGRSYAAQNPACVQFLPAPAHYTHTPFSLVLVVRFPLTPRPHSHSVFEQRGQRGAPSLAVATRGSLVTSPVHFTFGYFFLLAGGGQGEGSADGWISSPAAAETVISSATPLCLSGPTAGVSADSTVSGEGLDLKAPRGEI